MARRSTSETRTLKSFTKKDLGHWLFLSKKLWPDHSAKELKELFPILLSPRKYFFKGCVVAGEWAGFIYAGLRRDYVEGSSSSPVGYVEGIYVLPKFRRRGIAKALLAQAEAWAFRRGCTEMGSDAYRRNRLSRKAHAGWGFAEAGEMVAFIKKIDRKNKKSRRPRRKAAGF